MVAASLQNQAEESRGASFQSGGPGSPDLATLEEASDRVFVGWGWAPQEDSELEFSELGGLQENGAVGPAHGPKAVPLPPF